MKLLATRGFAFSAPTQATYTYPEHCNDSSPASKAGGNVFEAPDVTRVSESMPTKASLVFTAGERKATALRATARPIREEALA